MNEQPLSQPSLSPSPSQPKRPLLVVGVCLFIILATLTTYLFMQNQSLKQQLASLSNPTPLPAETSAKKGDPTATWKTYKYQQLFEIKIPNDLKIIDNGRIEIGDYLSIGTYPINPEACRGDCTIIETKVSKTINGLEVRYLTGWWGEIGGNIAQSYIGYLIPQNGKYIYLQMQELPFSTKTSLVREKVGKVSVVNSKLLDQILSTFKFIDQSSDPEGRFCGGISGVICPDGYGCKYDNHYPDASGECIKGFESGTLEAKVVRSPTCAGPVTGQETCEGPYVNGTFKIMRLPGNEDIQTITTDKDGTFSTSLNPGVYNLQNTESGIGKNIRNPSFTIAGGKSTIQRFDIDTGIR